MWGTRAQTQQNGAVHETGPGTWYLGIDLGTGGLKVGAVDLAGKVLASAFGSIDTVNTEDGGNEQDPFVWFDALVSAGREITTALRGGAPAQEHAGGSASLANGVRRSRSTLPGGRSARVRCGRTIEAHHGQPS